ncbi:MAG: hypothetical protein MHPSP_000119, partial [Paramarteilia canceri]
MAETSKENSNKDLDDFSMFTYSNMGKTAWEELESCNFIQEDDKLQTDDKKEKLTTKPIKNESVDILENKKVKTEHSDDNSSDLSINGILSSSSNESDVHETFYSKYSTDNNNDEHDEYVDKGEDNHDLLDEPLDNDEGEVLKKATKISSILLLFKGCYGTVNLKLPLNTKINEVCLLIGHKLDKENENICIIQNEAVLPGEIELSETCLTTGDIIEYESIKVVNEKGPFEIDNTSNKNLEKNGDSTIEVILQDFQTSNALKLYLPPDEKISTVILLYCETMKLNSEMLSQCELMFDGCFLDKTLSLDQLDEIDDNCVCLD